MTQANRKGGKETGWRFIRRPEWSLLVLTSQLIYIKELALKRSSNYIQIMNPSTLILVISQLRVHVTTENNKTRHHISALIQHYR
jgi:hypothetical protein